MASPAYFAHIFFLIWMSFAAITLLYIILIVRLNKHNSIAPQQSRISLAIVGNPTESTGNNMTTDHSRNHKKHVVGLKIFGAISVFYVASYVTLYAVGTHLVPIECAFLYFLNHVCNPVIYYHFNQEFRQKVQEVLKVR